MNKLKTFAYSYINSLTDPGYYNHVLQAKISFSIKYFFFFFVLLSIANTVVFSVQQLPTFTNTVNQTAQDLQDNYPPELVISLKDNTLSLSGVQQPFNVPFNPELEQVLNRSSHYDSLFTFDTATDSAYTKSMVTFTKNTLIYREISDTKERIEYSQLQTEPLLIDQAYINQTVTTLKEVIDPLSKIIPFIFFFFLAFFGPLTTMTLLAIYSLFTYSVANILAKPLTYKKASQIGLHAITLSETLGFFYHILYPNFDGSTFYSLSFFGTILIVIYKLKRPIYIIVKRKRPQ